MSCPFCKRTDVDGLLCDDDHCREPEHRNRLTRTQRQPTASEHRVELHGSVVIEYERCEKCGAILSVDGECVDTECPCTE